MTTSNMNGDNGLANHDVHFYYPSGGGDLNSAEEIFDYLKRTDYSYMISCREYPDFRGGIIRQPNGGYDLHMFFNNSGSGWVEINYGQRMTLKKIRNAISDMTKYINNHIA